MALERNELLAARSIPNAGRVVRRRRHHPLAVLAERRATHTFGMTLQDGGLPAALDVPDACGVIRRRHRALATACEGHTPHAACMPQHSDLLSIPRIPDARGVIEGRRCDPTAISAEGRVLYRAGVAFQKQGLFSLR